MLIQLGNTKGQEILRKARFSCQKGENYGEFNALCYFFNISQISY